MKLAAPFCLSVVVAFSPCRAQGWNLPAVGTEAPDFTIYNLSTGDSVTLSDLEGQKTVVLIFGSFT